MAQQDNILNARMAVSSTRDSSSMKALAVITAVFLPGEFFGTLFGMSMFNFQPDNGGGNDGSSSNSSNNSGSASGNMTPGYHIVSNLFWLYWSIVIPLTIVILGAWRAWWVFQDRHFRRHLPLEISEERYLTSDGKPRKLEHSFLYDFVRLSDRQDKPSTRTTSLETVPTYGSSMGTNDFRSLQQVLSARNKDIFALRREGTLPRGMALSV
jgi:hypothetical protein